MLLHTTITTPIFKRLVRNGQITLGGNKQLKIYGSLHCASGKRMNVTNRVFFASEQEAISAGYRPCGHCMREAYKQWKRTNKSIL